MEYLVVGVDVEGCLAVVVFGVDGLSAVVGGGWIVSVGFCGLYVWDEVDQSANGSAQCFVEIEQVFGWFFVEGSEVVGVEFKEGAVSVGCYQCVPMCVRPVAVVGYLYVSDGAFVAEGFFHGDGQCLGACGCGDDAAVAVGLFGEVFVCFDVYFCVGVESDEVFDGWEVGGWEQACFVDSAVCVVSAVGACLWHG